MTAVESYLKPEVINQIKRLDMRARFVVKGFLQGLHASPFQGFSVEFSEHRRSSCRPALHFSVGHIGKILHRFAMPITIDGFILHAIGLIKSDGNFRHAKQRVARNLTPTVGSGPQAPFLTATPVGFTHVFQRFMIF